MANCELGECKGDPKYTTPIVVPGLPNSGDGGGHEFVTDLPEKGSEGVEYVLMDNLSDCSTFKGTFAWNPDCEGWVQTSGSGGGGAIERYTFEQTATGWRAKRNNTVIFTYVDKDTIDSYENTADGFQITRNGVVIFTHTDGGGGDCKEYTITATTDGWVFKEDGVTKFTYTEPANDPSDGTYFTSGTLTTAITGTTTVAASSVTGLTLADVVIGETLIYDEAGTVGRVTAVSGTNLTVETITTAPGERRGTRLGAVDDYTDLPATCAAAVAMGWQTPLAGDFAYVREDTSHDSHLTEWVIQSIDSSCNITWGYSHTLNAGNYVLDIYKYGDYPSGSPIPKNPDGSVTLPKDADTKYDFENLMDGSDIIGWRVKDHDTGTVLYTYTDLNDNNTYTFEDVTVSGNVVGWKVKDKNGTVIYTYTDLNDKSDGTYFTSATLDTDITDQTTVAASTVTGLTLADVVVGETLIYDGDGTVGVVTAVSGSNLTVDTITVSGSGDASSYVYKTTGTLDTTVDNTVNLALSTLSNSAGTTPTASDIIIGKTLAWDADGTVALAVAISGTDVTFRTITTSGGGGGSYLVDDNGDALVSGMFKLIQSGKADTPDYNDYGTVQVNKDAIMPFHKISGDIETGATQGTFKVKPGQRIEASIHFTLCDGTSGSGGYANVRAWLYNVTDSAYCKGDSNEQIPSAYSYTGEYGITVYGNSGYAMGRSATVQWTNNTDHIVELGFRIGNFDSGQSGMPAYFRTDATSMAVHEIGRLVDPIKYLDNSKGLQDTPVGNIISYMGNNVPRHYLACDGTIYNIGDYPALEAHFVEEFGRVNYFGGNGTTTWAVPDLQGEFLRGTGTNSHAEQGSGAAVGTHQDATIEVGVMSDVNNTYITNPGGNFNIGYSKPDYQYTSTNRNSRELTIKSTGVQPSISENSRYTSRPTNTSVKYCIKYESTMQVILGNEQYKEKATLSYSLAKNTMAFPTLTHVEGDSMIGSGYTAGQANAFVAPVDGWYSVSFYVPESADVSGLTYHACYLYKNGAVVGGQERDDNSNDLRVPMNCTTTIRLKKGDKVAWAWYWGGTFTNTYTRTGEADFVLLTSSVEINEVNLIAADDVYSTDEQLVGSYLGKPMYQKTVPVTLPGSDSQASTTNHNISNFGSLVSMELVWYDTVDKRWLVGTRYYQGSGSDGYSIGTESFSVSSTQIRIVGLPNTMDWASRTSNAYVTIRYTKTTDTAGSAPNKNSLLLTRPDLWTPGTEYDFGGGLYGKRITGNVTLVSGTRQDVVVTSGISSSGKIISQGGSINTSQNWRCPVPWGYANHASAGGTYFEAAVYTRAASDHCLYLYTDVAPGATSYDVWITYTK